MQDEMMLDAGPGGKGRVNDDLIQSPGLPLTHVAVRFTCMFPVFTAALAMGYIGYLAALAK